MRNKKKIKKRVLRKNVNSTVIPLRQSIYKEDLMCPFCYQMQRELLLSVSLIADVMREDICTYKPDEQKFVIDTSLS